MATSTAPAIPLPPCSHAPRAWHGDSRADTLARRKQYLTPALLTYYKEPLMVVEGHMQWLFDETGRRYLDCLGGIVTVSVGHCHPQVTAAMVEQVQTLVHSTTIYLHPNVARFGERIIKSFPADSGLEVCYFTSSGSEANELAILMARLFTGNSEIIALRNAYHGMTNQAMGLAGLATWKQPLPQGLGVRHARCPDLLRGPWGAGDPNAAAKYADEVNDVIRFGTNGAVAGFIAEPIQGVGGVVEMPMGYLKAAHAHVRAAGGVCISDEVQTGFGRTGEGFWGYERHGVRPDIVTMAKSIGNGAPLAACVTTRAIAQSMTKRLHFNTYGGNPVSTAAGLATLDVIESEGLQERSRRVGGRFRAGLERLMERHAIVGDVRGRGLLLGIELVEDRTTMAPSGKRAAFVHERARELGLLVGKGGLSGQVLRMAPPMCVDEHDVDFALAVLDQCLTEAASCPS
ncbi:MAG: aspartate aminotransferase family protein [Planctomycetota bacterium]|nr:aspartate aminotransferase family protein [Planctomycetota bacterium]